MQITSPDRLNKLATAMGQQYSAGTSNSNPHVSTPAQGAVDLATLDKSMTAAEKAAENNRMLKALCEKQDIDLKKLDIQV